MAAQRGDGGQAGQDEEGEHHRVDEHGVDEEGHQALAGPGHLEGKGDALGSHHLAHGHGARFHVFSSRPERRK